MELIVTLEEKTKAAEYLAATGQALRAAVSDLSEAQWRFKPAPDRWSAVEVVEHLAIIEARVEGIIGGMAELPVAEPDRNDSQIDENVIAAVPLRSTKVQAPAVICPTGQWSPQEALDRFVAGRNRTLGLLASASHLRGHVRAHPFLGPLDGYQWFLALAGHTARHTAQIEEVKADALFPAMDAVASA
jgi:hypothetical protein